MELGGDSATRSPAMQWRDNAARRFQYFLDKSAPHPVARWFGSLVVAILYCFRVYYVQGFYIVAYGLGIYILNLLIGFLSPQADLETEGPALPTKGSDEFKPFIRRLPEFKFCVWASNIEPIASATSYWVHLLYALTKAFCIALVLTFFSVFDVPVFWPILLVYWMVLFVLTMKRQIKHMIKYKYVPFSVGKQRYVGKKSSAKTDSSKD